MYQFQAMMDELKFDYCSMMNVLEAGIYYERQDQELEIKRH